MASDPLRPATVGVAPATVQLTALGATEQLTAEVRDQNGKLMAGAAVSWSSSAAAVATVSASGLVTAATNGTATITATAGSASGSATATVAQGVSTVAVSTTTDTMALGATRSALPQRRTTRMGIPCRHPSSLGRRATPLSLSWTMRVT